MNLFVKLIILLPVIFFTNVSNSEVRNIFIEKNKIITLSGNFIQGGLIKGKAFPNANIKFLDKKIFLDEKNRFVFGFGRDFENKAIISITYKKKLITKSFSFNCSILYGSKSASGCFFERSTNNSLSSK